jgi:hypothetical protein
MFKASTPLLRALLARWTVKIDDDISCSAGWQIERGHSGRTTYRDLRFLTLGDRGSFLARSFPTVGRAP